MDRIISKIAPLQGIELINKLAINLAEKIEADYVVIGGFYHEVEKMEMISCTSMGSEVFTIDPTVGDIFCKDVLNSKLCIYPKEVQLAFPKEKILSKLDVSGVIAYPLFASNVKKPIGIIICLFKEEIKKHESIVKGIEAVARLLALGVYKISKAKETLHTNFEIENQIKFYNNSPLMCFYVDFQGKVVDVNNVSVTELGYSKEELVGHSVLNVFHENDKKEVERRFLDLIENKDYSAVWEFRKIHKNGKLIWVKEWLQIQNIGGKQFVMILCENINERVESGIKLKESIKETTNVRDALNESSIVVITNLKGEITFVNDAFCKISQYSRKELLGSDHKLLNSGHHSKKFIRELWNTIIKGSVWRNEVKNKAKDGSFIWLDTTITPILDEEGNPFQYITIRNDITGRKVAEEKLKSSLLDKDILLKEVHHRVKNNLQIISALLSLKETDSPEVADFVRESKARINSMSSLHEMLYQLDEISKFSFEAYVETIVGDLFMAYGAYAKNISHKILIEDHIQLRLKDAINLGLLITEIVTNSLKYAFEGRDSGEIVISFTDGDDLIHLNIKDNGVGYCKKDGEKTTMGCLIIESLSRQLGGNIEIVNNSGMEYYLMYKNQKDSI